MLTFIFLNVLIYFITVEVTGYSADNCSISYTSFNNETLVGSVIRSASVLVLPEGLHRTDTQSAYFCANGKWPKLLHG